MSSLRKACLQSVIQGGEASARIVPIRGGEVQDLSSSEPSDANGPDGLRVIRTDGPLGSMRLTVRAIAAAEGFVLCRHGSLRPQVLSEREWRALPLASEENFDL